MEKRSFDSFEIKDTPYFLYDISQMRENILKYKDKKFGFYYNVKSCLFPNLISQIEDLVDGFTVAAIGDLEKVRKETQKPIHYVSPMIRKEEVEAINSLGSSVSFNSINHLNNFGSLFESHIKKFMRVNPELSFVEDSRYDPSRKNSHLGIPLSEFSKYLKDNPSVKVDNLHFHNSCLNDNPENLSTALEHIESQLDFYLDNFKTINLGGGYLFNERLLKILNQLSEHWEKKYGINLFIEPGFDISNNAGYLVSRVVDVLKNEINIAVLDTTVNHVPEVFEYEIIPPVLNSVPEGQGHAYLLTGCTCLAGDLLGTHHFKEPLKIGDPVIFTNVGSYSYVKCHEFNGVKKPLLKID